VEESCWKARCLGKWIQSGWCFLLKKEKLCIICYRECLGLWWTITGGILKLALTWWRDLCSIKHVRNVNPKWFQKGVARKLWNDDIYLWWVQRLYHQLLGDKHVGVGHIGDCCHIMFKHETEIEEEIPCVWRWVIGLSQKLIGFTLYLQWKLRRLISTEIRQSHMLTIKLLS